VRYPDYRAWTRSRSRVSPSSPAAAFVAPLLGDLVPGLRLPNVVLELGLGILVGPSVLGWAHADEPVQVLALIGLSFLLLIAGLEVDYERLRGRLLRATGLGFAASVALGLVCGLALKGAGLVRSPLLIAVMFSATGLGIVIAVLKDAGQVETPFGQLVIAGSSIAEVGTIVLPTLFFSGESSSIGAKLVLLGLFGAFCAAVALVVARAGRSMRVMEALVRLQDTTSQIRVRGAFLLLAAFVVLASSLGLEAILGAFLAGAILKLVDRDEAMTHPRFRAKLEAAGSESSFPSSSSRAASATTWARFSAARRRWRAFRSSWRCCWSCARCRRCCTAASQAAARSRRQGPFRRPRSASLSLRRRSGRRWA
jgi:Kef-type K+ transport system membrane component KefB